MYRIVVLAFALLLLAAPTVAFAGSPHFVDDQTSITTSGATITATGKIAGLGDETQVHVVLTADAQCINLGGNPPQAANKASVVAEGDFPVQNGKAYFSLSATAVFQPPCSPPMTVAFSNVVVTDTTHGISFP
jgi:hypothetical protein